MNKNLAKGGNCVGSPLDLLFFCRVFCTFIDIFIKSNMSTSELATYFFGGFFAGNAVPHIVAGASGRAFPTPFSNPPGKGLSSSIVNVLWGSFNAVVGYYLLFQAGNFDIRDYKHAAACGLGAFVLYLLLARLFGKVYGGDLQPDKKK